MKYDTVGAYEALAKAIRDILAGEGTYISRIQSCFMASLDHWERLKEILGGLDFDSEEEEILFFKATKPRFTGLVEYFTQCYQALLFIPDRDQEGLLYFWRMELRRIERFHALHADFVQYYKEGNTELDELYFLRAYSDHSNLAHARVYDLDDRSSSSHDWLVSKLVGLEMYRKDVEEEIARLQNTHGIETEKPTKIT
jgi:hypothetical protein